jgi:HEAT repeat protein
MLLTCLQTTRDGWVLEGIAHALATASFGEQVSLEPLLDLVENDSSERVRAYAVRALGQLGARAPIDLLTATLGDSQQLVREAAAEALQCCNPEALYGVEAEATAILQGRGPGMVLGSLVQNFVAEAIIDMEYTTPAILETLTQLLNWPYWQVRLKAIQAFGKIRRNIPDSALRRLLELRHDPQSQAVRRVANNVLAEVLSLETGIEDE